MNMMFSIIIANYNYARFISDAINSVLIQDWPKFEIIVVDDGSTDESAQIIRSFGHKVKAFFRQNGGQREANNFGFAQSRGDIVIFLDADDVLVPGALRAIGSVWREGLSKVQVQMQRVDEQKNPIRNVIPRIPKDLSFKKILQWAYTTSEYPSPPGSGNAWSRKFLEKFFPIKEDYDAFTDSTCIAMAPYLGDIETIEVPFVLYRMHGENDSNLSNNNRNFSREIARSLKRHAAACDACKMAGLPPPSKRSLFRGPHLLQLRVASLRLTPEHKPLVSDSRKRALYDALLILFRPSFEKFYVRLIISAWSILALTTPEKISRKIIAKRFA
ncbi:glycosyl transferase family 2 [Kozakia baliensis]|uniref:Glycosyl transferase family 2 n=2 Tax=Kozakia baliensis TaxID=153496 RepID=A0A1D8UVK5_9PROT|nr:glycosyl transferase family 2 [Kozakia baliensis]